MGVSRVQERPMGSWEGGESVGKLLQRSPSTPGAQLHSQLKGHSQFPAEDERKEGPGAPPGPGPLLR